jgi:hypothetical protein
MASFWQVPGEERSGGAAVKECIDLHFYKSDLVL